MKNLNEQSYNQIAEQFASDRTYAVPHPLVIKFADLLTKDGSVLDAGCGTGVPNAKYLSSKGLQITGIDFSAKLLEKARVNLPRFNFIKGDLTKFHTEEKFDGIIAWDSLFHLKPDQHKPVFRKLFDFLKPDGLLLFTHGGGMGGEISGEMFGYPFYYSAPGPEKTRIILEDLGFGILEWDIDETGNGYMIGLVKKPAADVIK